MKLWQEKLGLRVVSYISYEFCFIGVLAKQQRSLTRLLFSWPTNTNHCRCLHRTAIDCCHSYSKAPVAVSLCWLMVTPPHLCVPVKLSPHSHFYLLISILPFSHAPTDSMALIISTFWPPWEGFTDVAVPTWMHVDFCWPKPQRPATVMRSRKEQLDLWPRRHFRLRSVWP